MTVELDIEPFFEDIYQKYKTADSKQARILRHQMSDRHDRFDRWLVEHGYQCGRDYQSNLQGYRFASEALASMFVLGVK